MLKENLKGFDSVFGSGRGSHSTPFNPDNLSGTYHIALKGTGRFNGNKHPDATLCFDYPKTDRDPMLMLLAEDLTTIFISSAEEWKEQAPLKLSQLVKAIGDNHLSIIELTSGVPNRILNNPAYAVDVRIKGQESIELKTGQTSKNWQTQDIARDPVSVFALIFEDILAQQRK
jgi:hypothetical protein